MDVAVCWSPVGELPVSAIGEGEFSAEFGDDDMGGMQASFRTKLACILYRTSGERRTAGWLRVYYRRTQGTYVAPLAWGYRLGGVASRTTAPWSSLKIRIENFAAPSRSFVLRLA